MKRPREKWPSLPSEQNAKTLDQKRGTYIHKLLESYLTDFHVDLT